MDQLVYDPDGDDTPTVVGVSDLARLRKDAESYTPAPLRYRHPVLPQYTLVFERKEDLFEVMQSWRKKCVTRAARAGREEEIDLAKFNRMIVAGTNTAVEAKDSPVLDSDGNPVTFRSRQFMGEFGVTTSEGAVKAFIRSDPAIAALASRIIDDSGVGGDVEAVGDPTGGDTSSSND